MADYTLSRLRKVGDAVMYEVRLPDGSSNRFIYSGAQKAVDPSDEAFARWVAISIRRAARHSAFKSAAHG